MPIDLRALFFAGFACFAAQPALAQSTAPADPAAKSGDVVVQPEIKRPAPPDGDPRTNDERRRDRAAFGKCLLNAQTSREDSLSSPGIAPNPMTYCQQRLGMANYYDVPKQTRAKQR